MHRVPAGSLIRAMPIEDPSNELPARAMKRMASLGHHLALWTDALAALRNRLAKDRLPETWRTHVLAGLPEGTGAVDSLALTVHLPVGEPAGWTVEPRRDEPTPALTASARALLHLPALQKTWATWLRGNVLADLLERLGRAWIVDPSSLPSQGALPGLGIARWADFHRLADSGRRFRLEFKHGDQWTLDPSTVLADWQTVAGQLAGCALGGAVVEELPGQAGTLLEVSFALRAGRWELA